MSQGWFYVHKGQRTGPVDLAVVAKLIGGGELTGEDYVWRKGFENWLKIKDVEELSVDAPALPDIPAPVLAAPTTASFRLGDLRGSDKLVYLRIGVDRGGVPTEYGPYSMELVRRLFNENRINGRTQIFVKGHTQEWVFLADAEDFEATFNEVPPVIQDTERRRWVRKPLLARLFVQNNKQVYEGVCRDISVGGMQVLTDAFPGSAGDKIAINVHPENSEYHFTASGTVVRLLDGNQGFSFRFDPLQQEAKQAIEKYIRDVDPSL